MKYALRRASGNVGFDQRYEQRGTKTLWIAIFAVLATIAQAIAAVVTLCR